MLLVIMSGVVSVSAQNVGGGKKAEKPPLRSWWITGVSITKSESAVMVKLAVCSEDKGLIAQLTRESWEVKATPENTAGIVMVYDPIASIDSGGPPLPKKMVGMIGRVVDDKLEALLNTEIRLKGEQDWLRLGSVIRVEGDAYSLYRCSRCGADRKSGAWKCAACGAQYGPRP